MRQEIAKIESTFLGMGDHGIYTAMLQVTYGGSGQMVGGFCLSQHDDEAKAQRGTAYGMEWIRRCLLACGVDSWEKIAGRTVMILKSDYDECLGIAPLPTEPGKSFIFAELTNEYRGSL